MACDAESGLLLVVSDGRRRENVGAIQTADGETAWTVGAGMDVEQARLILDADGEAYLCGTERSDGQSAAPSSDGFGSRRQIKTARPKGGREAVSGTKQEENMNTDIVIVGAGPAGIFTAIEMIRRGSKKHITIVEKGQAD